MREAIAQTYPDIFHDFNARMFQPGGFPRPIAARHRKWQTNTGKANFIIPSALDADPDMVAPSAEVLRLMTLRSAWVRAREHSDDFDGGQGQISRSGRGPESRPRPRRFTHRFASIVLWCGIVRFHLCLAGLRGL